MILSLPEAKEADLIISQNESRSAFRHLCLASVLVTCLAASVQAQPHSFSVGNIYYYGYEGLNLDLLRDSLPIKVGEEIPANDMTGKIQSTQALIQKSYGGKTNAEISPVCCNPQGKWIIYVGLPGQSAQVLTWRNAPKGNQRLPQEALSLNDQMMAAWMDAMQKGNISEDGSHGYSLLSDEKTRSIQLQIREYALKKEKLFADVLNNCDDPKQRAIAAQFLGYVEQSKEQVNTLVMAAQDPDDAVRNNAIRALAVLAGANKTLASQIPYEPFVAMLKSSVWKDRNKSIFLLGSLSRLDDKKLDAALLKDAIEPLAEIAVWDDEHASSARAFLHRIAPQQADKLDALIKSADAAGIIKAIRSDGAK